MKKSWIGIGHCSGLLRQSRRLHDGAGLPPPGYADAAILPFHAGSGLTTGTGFPLVGRFWRILF